MPDAEGYMPILVGAAKNYKPEIEYQRDDEGENISSKNPNYNELTAVLLGLEEFKRYRCSGPCTLSASLF